MGNFDLALPLLQDASERSRQLFGVQHPNALTVSGKLGGALAAMSRAVDLLPPTPITHHTRAHTHTPTPPHSLVAVSSTMDPPPAPARSHRPPHIRPHPHTPTV